MRNKMVKAKNIQSGMRLMLPWFGALTPGIVTKVVHYPEHKVVLVEYLSRGITNACIMKLNSFYGSRGARDYGKSWKT